MTGVFWSLHVSRSYLVVVDSNHSTGAHAVERSVVNLGGSEDLSGQTFGRLTAMRAVEKRGSVVFYLCSCACGKTATGKLRLGNCAGAGTEHEEILWSKKAKFGGH